MARTAVDIGAQACVLVGLGPISSFDDGSAEANALDVLYEEQVAAELTGYRWSFCTAQATLAAPLTETPVIDFDYAFQLPTATLWLHGAYEANSPINYQLINGKVYCNVTADLQVQYTFRADEAYWPAYFAEAMIRKIAGILAASVCESADMAKLQEEIFLQRMARARTLDAQAHPSKPLRATRLITVRRS